jgi:hypothetical protein
MAPEDTRRVPTASTTSVPSVGKGLDEGLERGAGAADRDVGVAQLERADGEALGLLGLPAQRLDDQRALEGLVGDVGDVGPQLLGPADPGDIARW